MKILITSLIDLKRSQHNRPHQFIKHLSKNHEITVVSINDWWKHNQLDLDNYERDFDFLNLINYQYITEKKIAPFLQEFFFTKKIKKLSKENFDVHFNYNSLVTGYEASKIYNTVFDIADDIPRMIEHSPQIPSYLRNVGYKFGKYFIKKNIKNASHITLTNEILGKIYDIPEKKIEILPNGVDLSLFKHNKNAKEILGFGEEFIVGYVGVLREWVNFKPLFEALKLLDFDAKVLVVGNEGNFNGNVKLAEKCGVSDKVIFRGTVPYSKVPLYISAMDICVIPFFSNSISNSAVPLKLFEYLACEKPIISTKIDAINDIFGDIIMNARTSQDYAQIISIIHENSDFMSKKIKKGKKIAQNYDWENITSKLENILIDSI